VPGSIQAHGVLLAVDPERSFTVVAVSRNATEMLPSVPGGFIGRGIAGILGPCFTETLQRRFRDGKLPGNAAWQSTLRLDGHAQALDATVHGHAGLILIELERASARDAADAQTAIRQLQEIIVDLRETGSDLDELAQVAADGVRLLTGYERVVIYRFDSDWNGQAIAEDKVADWNHSLAGVRFPASDIPAQARALYRHSPMRWVVDRDAVAVPLDVDPAWTGGTPPHAIDLSFARLRSLSPIHLQIHRNLGVNGSMSLSILHRERLWGLVVCHHRQPHYPSHSQRSAASALTDAFALRVGPTERANNDQARREDLVRLSTLLAHMAEADVVTVALTTGDVTIGHLFASTGAAVLHDGTVSLLGDTPPEADVRKLAAWLRTRNDTAKLFQTSNVATVYPAWEQHAAVASGVLAVFLSADRSDLLLWFRPEEAELVSWGGQLAQRGGGVLQVPLRAVGRDAARLREAMGRVGAGDGRKPPARHHRGDGTRPAPARRPA
jgi:light-regulated signal transduction histidine kinase (bacteriophytochrome)